MSSARTAQWSAVVPSASGTFTAPGRFTSALTASLLPDLTASIKRASAPSAPRLANAESATRDATTSRVAHIVEALLQVHPYGAHAYFVDVAFELLLDRPS